MKDSLNSFAEIVAKTNDIFYSQHKNIDTIMGIIDKNLRNQGMQADAITLDCISRDKKIVFLLHDDKPDIVNIAIGNKAGDIFSSSEYVRNDFCEATLLDIMEKNFLS